MTTWLRGMTSKTSNYRCTLLDSCTVCFTISFHFSPVCFTSSLVSHPFLIKPRQSTQVTRSPAALHFERETQRLRAIDRPWVLRAGHRPGARPGALGWTWHREISSRDASPPEAARRPRESANSANPRDSSADPIIPILRSPKALTHLLRAAQAVESVEGSKWSVKTKDWRLRRQETMGENGD